ncbi:MAG: AAA family ATPase [Candidatus Binataceae bacterium]
MSDEPWLWLIAGPNGAGKSTYIDDRFEPNVEVVRPDEIALRLSPGSPERALLRAGREAVGRIRALTKDRQGFAVETTLSGKLHLRLVESAKRRGWKVGLAYIGLGSADLAIERVRQRKLAGGMTFPREMSAGVTKEACAIWKLLTSSPTKLSYWTTRLLKVR